MSDIEGKTARVAASEAGAKRVSMDTKPNGNGAADSKPLNNSTSQRPGNDDVMPNSRRVYVAGVLHPDIRVPFREISLAPTKTMSGEIEVNEPVRVYDTSGPWGDNSAS